MKCFASKKAALWGGAFLAFSFFASTAVHADPPPWAKAHGYRAKKHEHHEHEEERHYKKHYSYIYYPSSQVYYSPVVKRYYYLNNGAWMQSPTAPLSINLGKSVSITLGGSTPYVYHPMVVKEYPAVVIPAP